MFPRKVPGFLHLRDSFASSARRKRGLVPACIEVLEDRTLLTQFLVDTLTDEDLGANDAVSAAADGAGLSLREAIRLANENGGGTNQGQVDFDEIIFAGPISGGTIVLNAGLGELSITDDLVIDGFDQDFGDGFDPDVTISGDGSTRIFEINTSSAPGLNDVELRNLVLTDGRAFNGNGGAVESLFGSDLTLSSVVVSLSSADFSGGGLSVAGTTTIEFSDIIGNQARDGGGIANFGTLTIDDSNVGGFDDGNTALNRGGGIFNTGTLTLNGFTRIDSNIARRDSVDLWEQNSASAGNLVFGYVDTQNATIGSSPILNVRQDDGITLIESDDGDGANGPVVAGAPAGAVGSVFFEVTTSNGTPVDDYQLYTSIVDPNLAFDEVEGNDTIGNANAIASDQLVRGSANTSDTDFFSLGNVAAGMRIVVMMDDDPDNNGTLTDTELSIVNSLGLTVADGDDLSFNDGNAAGAFDVTVAGQYFVRVANGNIGSEFNYQFVAQVVDPTPDGVIDVEPNNSLAAAQNIDNEGFSRDQNADITDSTNLPHVTISGTGDGTFDYFSFDAITGQRGVFDIDGASFDTELFLFDPNGNLEAQNDDNGGDPGSDSSLNSLIDVNFALSGRYVIGVARFSSFVGSDPQEPIEGDTPPSGGTYTLHVSVGSHPENSGGGGGLILESEPNGTPASAQVLQSGQFGQGTVGGLGRGGGIFNDGGSVTSDTDGSIRISSNEAGGTGGGLASAGSGSLDLTGVEVSSNSAVITGGGIEIENGTANFTGLEIESNNAGEFFGTANQGNGGGLAITGSADVMIIGGHVSSNDAQADGGGIWNNAGTLTIEGADIGSSTSSFGNPIGGNSAEGNGGGIWSGVNGSLTIRDGNLVGNEALGDGGAIANLGTADLNDTLIGPRDRGTNTFERQDADAGDLVFAYVDSQFSSVDINLEVRANDASSLNSATTRFFDGPVIAGTEIPPGQDGSAFFDVTPVSGGFASDYELFAAVVDSADAVLEVESNDTRATSQLLDFTGRPDGVLIEGSVQNGDTDFFRLENVAAGSQIVVMLDDDIDGDGFLTDVSLYISDQFGRVAFGDNFDSTRGNAVTYEVFTGGTFYVELDQFFVAQDGDYRFVVQVLQPDDGVPFTFDPDAPSPTVLVAGQFGQGEISSAGSNFATRGGAIFNQGDVVVTGGAIRNNQANGMGSTDGGGGVFNDGGLLDFNSTSLTGNGAISDGGAIYNLAGDVFISGFSQLDANSAETGGAIYNTGFLDVVGAFFTGNQARADGGAIANFADATLSLTEIGGERVSTDLNDIWEIPNANVNDLIFAFVDAQNAVVDRDPTLTVYSGDESFIEFDNNDGPSLFPVVAGAAVPQAGSVFLEVRGFADNPVDDYQLYAAVVSPNDLINEVEGNNSTASAQTVTTGLGTAFVAGSAGPNDLDHFRLAGVSANDRIVLMVDDDPDNNSLLTDTEVDILDSNGVPLAFGDDLSTNDGNAAGAWTAQQPGDYFLRIGNGNIGTETNYRFVVQVLSPDPASVNGSAEVEPNNTIATAQDIDDAGFSLAPDANITDSTNLPHVTINGTGDGTFDYYQFDAVSGQRGVFDIDGASFDTELFLFDSNGTVLAQNDDSGSDPGSNSFLNSFIDYTFLTSGTFFIGVGRFNSFTSSPPANPQEPIEGSTPPVGGTYTLHVSIGGHALSGGGQVDERDTAANSNDFFDSANGIVLGQFGQGNLGTQRQNEDSSNTAVRGGGVFNAGNLLMDLASVVQNNIATGEGGGGIYNTGSADIANFSEVIDNSAANDGGGIYNTGAVDIEFGSRVDGNQAVNGGGVYNTVAGQLTLSNASLSSNLAERNGGAIANFGSINANDNTVIGIAKNALANTDEIDYWQRTGAAVGELIFVLADARNSMINRDLRLTALADDGTQIEFDDNDGPNLSPVVAGAAVTQAGNVFFEVDGFSESEVENYQLYTAIVGPAADVVDAGSNDSIETAQSNFTVTPNTEGLLVSGNLDDALDFDFYDLGSVAADSVVVVMMDDAVGDDLLTDTDLFLVDAQGNILATANNFSGANGNGVIYQTGDSLPENIFIRVGDGGFGTDTSYRFVVQIHQITNTIGEVEPNDEPSVAETLLSGQVGQGGVGGLFVPGANVAHRGGGIWNAAGTVQLDNTRINGNQAIQPVQGTETRGGGIFNDTGTVTITTTQTGPLDLKSEVSDNFALGNGGGIWNGGTIQIGGTIIESNMAMGNGSHGGGIYNEHLLTLDSGTEVNLNAAAGSGGGIFHGAAASPGNPNLILNGASLVGNMAMADGGAISNSGTAELTDTIVGSRARASNSWQRENLAADHLIFSYVDTNQSNADVNLEVRAHDGTTIDSATSNSFQKAP